MNAVSPAMPRSALMALADAMHEENMQRMRAIGQTRSPKSRTREADLPLGVVGTPIPRTRAAVVTWSVSIAWWWLPVACVVLGVLGMLLCFWWGERQGGGYLSGLAEGLIGIALFLIGVCAALGIVIGRWLS